MALLSLNEGDSFLAWSCAEKGDRANRARTRSRRTNTAMGAHASSQTSGRSHGTKRLRSTVRPLPKTDKATEVESVRSDPCEVEGLCEKNRPTER